MPGEPVAQPPARHVGTMVGDSPAWLVDGSARWADDRVPIKTLWVLRATAEPVRITGRRLDRPGLLTMRRGEGMPAESYEISNPGAESVMPGGAPAEIAREYVFLPSHVFYPSPGCWQFTIQIGREAFHVVRDLK